MTKDEALKLALEALENISTSLREDDVLGSDSELMLNAITAIKEALEECDEDELIIRYHEMTIKRLEKRIEELTVQPPQEPDYKEALRVLSLALEEAPTNLTPTQRSVWQQSKAVLLSGGGMA
jgi:tetratricopeptide (TPR) repeat protein